MVGVGRCGNARELAATRFFFAMGGLVDKLWEQFRRSKQRES